jgi:hypothetical protein
MTDFTAINARLHDLAQAVVSAANAVNGRHPRHVADVDLRARFGTGATLWHARVSGHPGVSNPSPEWALEALHGEILGHYGDGQ